MHGRKYSQRRMADAESFRRYIANKSPEDLVRILDIVRKGSAQYIAITSEMVERLRYLEKCMALASIRGSVN